MTRILFVDDETHILEGLQRSLRPQKDLWEISFAPGAEIALAMLEAAPFDVIVSDMRMPGMDGAALLDVVCKKYPDVLRIILSGYTDFESALRTVPVAQQFLSKPCESEALRTAIGRGTSLVEVFRSKMLASMIGSLQDLPSVPRTYAELRSALAAPDTSIDQIARIVQKDPAIAAKILQLVNSAFFGISREVADIKTAVTLLGINVLQNLVLSVEVVRSFQPRKPIPGFSIEEFQEHSRLTASIAVQISKKGTSSGSIVLAGLLHDVGKLIIAERAPEHFSRILSAVKLEGRASFTIEEELIGVTHAEVGAYLLSLWGIPFPIVEAVAHHHHPDRVPRGKWDMSTFIYLANLLAHEHVGAAQQDIKLTHSSIDTTLLDTIGGAELLPEWHRLAQEVVREPQKV